MRMGEVSQLLLGKVEVRGVDVLVDEPLAQDARLGSGGGRKAPARVERPLILDRRDVAHTIHIPQVEARGDIVGLPGQVGVANHQLIGLGEGGRSRAAKCQQYEKSDGNDSLGSSLHARPHSPEKRIGINNMRI